MKRLKTWHIERVVYAGALLVAARAQPGMTQTLELATSGNGQALLSVVALASALAVMMYAAELASIAAREREEAESRGITPVTVECSTRADEVRRAMRWVALLGIWAAFGWVAIVGWAWMQGYPYWRRWYRARYPLRRPAIRLVELPLERRGAPRR